MSEAKPIRIKRIDHVAICVRDVDEARQKWAAAFGLEGSTRELVASQKTDALLLTVGAGETAVELIAPKGNEGLEKFLDKRGPGLHHVAIEVEDIEGALAFLRGLGVKLIDEVPRLGARGHKVAFIHPSVTGGVLVELVERGAHP